MISTAEVRRALAEGDPAGRRANAPWAGDVLPGPVPYPVHGHPTSRPAAVLCALFDEDDRAQVLLTRRASGLRSHTGQVSFPGGRLDPGETPLQAALREAEEEVNLDPATVEIIGSLSVLSTLINPAPITPFVGVLPGRPSLRPNPAEVDRVLTVALDELAAPGVYHNEVWPGPGTEERVIEFFDVVGDTVWGATARMLSDLLARVHETA